MIASLLVGFIGVFGYILISIFLLPFVKIKGGRESVFLSRRILSKFGKLLLCATFPKVEVHYIDKKAIDDLDYSDGIVVVGNHQSNLDVPLISGYLPISIGYVAKKEMRNWPFYGWWMKMSNCIFLDRKNPRQGIKDMKEAGTIIKDGYPTVIFPEGSRSVTGEIGEFKKGSFKLAIDTNGIVVPISLKGTYNIQSKGKLAMKFGREVKLIIGKPINVSQLDREAKKVLNTTVRDIIKENYDKFQRNIN